MPLLPALAVLLLSSTAHADTSDDKTPEVISTATTEVAAKKRGRSSGKRSSAKRPAARRPATRPASSSHARPASSSHARPSSGSQARPASSSHARPASSSHARPASSSHARPASSSHARPAARPANHARPASHARPGARPATHARPGARPAPHVRPRSRVVHHHYTPRRWVPAWHRYQLRGVPHWHVRYWSAGVFYYNPPPPRARVVVVEERNGETQRVKGRPSRAVNRNGDFAVGIKGGSYMSGYDGGGGYGDMGLGLSAELRPHEAIGLELDYSHHSQTWDGGSERSNNPLQASVKLYAFPWTHVSPFVSAGLTWDHRSISDEYWDGTRYQVANADDTLFGPHAGAGVEFNLNDKASVDFEARYVGFLNRDEADLSDAGALQGTMGLSFYF